MVNLGYVESATRVDLSVSLLIWVITDHWSWPRSPPKERILKYHYWYIPLYNWTIAIDGFFMFTIQVFVGTCDWFPVQEFLWSEEHTSLIHVCLIAFRFIPMLSWFSSLCCKIIGRVRKCVQILCKCCYQPLWRTTPFCYMKLYSVCKRAQLNL